MKSTQSTGARAEEIERLLKPIRFHARRFVENPDSPANPQSSIKLLLRKIFTPEELSDDSIGAIVLAMLVIGKDDKDRLTELEILQLIGGNLNTVNSDNKGL